VREQAKYFALGQHWRGNLLIFISHYIHINGRYV